MTAREWLAALADKLDAYAAAVTSARKARAAAESASGIRATLAAR